MSDAASRVSTLSPPASAIAETVRAWVAALPPGTASIEEEANPNYGGTLIHVRPSAPAAMDVTIGLGGDTSVDVFWGDGYRWEGMALGRDDVLQICDAIASGKITVETWSVGPFRWGRRCILLLPSGPAGDGTLPVPWFLTRWARRSVMKVPAWIAGAAEQRDEADEARDG
jgi:hypothetical protein